ncbi:MAG: NAD(P)H-hydrate epimerase [Lawsonella clevelandensis]
MNVYTADSIRAAEAPLLASLPEGDLMRRASYGLYIHVLDEIRRRCGTVYGSHILLVVGAGDNGGDTLWAGTYLRGKGAAVTAVLLNPTTPIPRALPPSGQPTDTSSPCPNKRQTSPQTPPSVLPSTVPTSR